jgi:hypothetical protein
MGEMSHGAEAAVRELVDRAAIQDLLLRYARGIDRRDWLLVTSCFTPEADTDYAWVFRGKIEGFVPVVRDGLARYRSTMHFLGNQSIVLAGDAARSETYCVAYHRPTAVEEQNDLLTIGLRYLDELARAGGTWRIRRRVVEFEWRRTDAGVLA